ncbi:MAG: ECF-type sigma factor [Planctomycetia bacterium]|nr:ECF-type sigma factor [Planctomycetia bacterium]
MKRLARKMTQEAPGRTLQATALVHEAYPRMVDVEEAKDRNSQGHCSAAWLSSTAVIYLPSARGRSSYFIFRWLDCVVVLRNGERRS